MTRNESYFVNIILFARYQRYWKVVECLNYDSDIYIVVKLIVRCNLIAWMPWNIIVHAVYSVKGEMRVHKLVTWLAKMDRYIIILDINNCSFVCYLGHAWVYSSYGNITIASEGLQNLCKCSAPFAFEQAVTFIKPHLPWHGASVFGVSSKGPQIPKSTHCFTTNKGYWGCTLTQYPQGVIGTIICKCIFSFITLITFQFYQIYHT